MFYLLTYLLRRATPKTAQGHPKGVTQLASSNQRVATSVTMWDLTLGKSQQRQCHKEIPSIND